MINRDNKKLFDEYLQSRIKSRLDRKSVRFEKCLGKHYLIWCGDLNFCDAPKAELDFFDYVNTLITCNGTPASSEYKSKLIRYGRRFFEWLSINKKGFRSITPAWLSTFKYRGQPRETKDEDTITEEEILIIAGLPAKNLVEKRVRAGACFLYLSGMRISAFTTMPIKAVNLGTLEVHQSPNLGMRTKNKKTATTHVMNIDPIMKIVRDWDQLIRPQLPSNGFWFSPLNQKTGEIDSTVVEVGEHRSNIFRKDLTAWLLKNQVLLHSPHDFRRGHTSFLWSRSKDNNDLLAIAQNLMQANLTTTELYANLQKKQAKSLVHDISSRSTTDVSNLEAAPVQKLLLEMNETYSTVFKRLDQIEKLLRSKNEFS